MNLHPDSEEPVDRNKTVNMLLQKYKKIQTNVGDDDDGDFRAITKDAANDVLDAAALAAGAKKPVIIDDDERRGRPVAIAEEMLRKARMVETFERHGYACCNVLTLLVVDSTTRTRGRPA